MVSRISPNKSQNINTTYIIKGKLKEYILRILVITPGEDNPPEYIIDLRDHHRIFASGSLYMGIDIKVQ